MNQRFIKGYLIIQVLVFGSVGLIILSALIGWAASSNLSAKNFSYREQAFQIAEAGVEYYRWHLAHAPQDFKDGQSSAGPYAHDYLDQNGNKIGTFTLTITPPPIGSTVVKIVSKGEVAADPAVSRSVETVLAIPSLAKYAVASNAKIRFGEGTEIFGPIFSNNGIRFDGLAHNLILSAKDVYDDEDHSGSNEFGVHTHRRPPPHQDIYSGFVAEEAPPSSVADRGDVFMAGREFPVPAIDFIGMVSNLAQLKTTAQAGGSYYGPSGGQGYRLVLKTNDTFDLYRVTSLISNPGSSCSNNVTAKDQPGWGTWSVKNQVFLGNHPIPSNGAIFIEDHVWVEGKIDGARLTIASGRFPDLTASRTNIIVNNDLLYTNYDGADIVGLIAQNNVSVGLKSANDLQIDAAMIAQNGLVGRFYYGNACGTEYVREKLTLNGMIATNQRYGFAYINGQNGEHVSGYETRDIIYDARLLYSPPPYFPLTSNHYEVISWREI
jgi:hypothetical protein